MARQSNVDVKDRREAVLSLLRREEPAAAIARRIGVSEPTLYRWRDEFIAAGEGALTGGNGKQGADPLRRRIAELEAQIEKRDQVIGEYTIASRIMSRAICSNNADVSNCPRLSFPAKTQIVATRLRRSN